MNPAGVVRVLAVCAAIASCHYPSPPHAGKGDRVRTATQADVQDCAYIGNFVENYGRGGVVWAQLRVQDLAAMHGATDIVWGPTGEATLSGKSYRCP